MLQFPCPGLKRTHTRAKLSAAISPIHGTAEYTGRGNSGDEWQGGGGGGGGKGERGGEF